MFQLLGSALSAAGSLAGLLRGNRAAREQNRINREQLELQRALGTAGITTGRGDRIRFVPGLGWVLEPSEVAANIGRASDAGERRAYTADETDRVERNLETFRRGRLANLLADRIMREMAARGDDTDSVTAALAEQNVAEAVEGRNNLARLLGMNAIRQGTSAQAGLDALGRGAQAGTRTALARARLMGPTMAMERRAGQRQSDTTDLSRLLTAARDPGDAFRGPSQVSQGLDAMLAARGGQSAGFTPQQTRFDASGNNLPVRLDQFGEAVRGFGSILNTWRGQGASPNTGAGYNLGSIVNPVGGASAGGFLF
jgi:hypothetical protein